MGNDPDDVIALFLDISMLFVLSESEPLMMLICLWTTILKLQVCHYGCSHLVMKAWSQLRLILTLFLSRKMTACLVTSVLVLQLNGSLSI